MKVTKMNDVADRHSCDASKKSERLREVAAEVMRAADFEELFCRKEMRSALSDFIIQQYTRTIAAVAEGTISKMSTGCKRNVEKQLRKTQRGYLIADFCDSMVTRSRHRVLAVLEM